VSGGSAIGGRDALPESKCARRKPWVRRKKALRVARAGLSAVAGVRAAGVACGLKKDGRPDLALVVADGPATGGRHVYAESRAGRPGSPCRSGICGAGVSPPSCSQAATANACTGRQGLRDAEATAAEVARLLGRPVGEVFVACDRRDRATAGHGRGSAGSPGGRAC